MSSTRSLYSAFALTIASDITLPELLPATGEADVTVTTRDAVAAGDNGDAWTINAAAGEVSGIAPGAGHFEVRNGNEIVITPFHDADPRAVSMAIVGPLFGVILSQRGRFVLHASTVAINGYAVAFAGPSGRGKSTLAAALTRAGHPLLADDMTVIEFKEGQPFVQPGFPRVKLWPDSASALEHDVDALPLIHPDRTKRSVRTVDAFQPAALPLTRCYLLDDGDVETITSPRGGNETVLALIRCTYQASWVHETGLSGANLMNCGALARSGVVRVLQRRKSFELIPAVIAMIEADVATAASVV